MLPTIPQILDLAVVRAGHPQVVGGALDERPVRWVHVSDADDLSGLLTGGELVLTVGTAFAASARETRDYIVRLVKAGALGLVVELGTKIDAVPPSACQVADELGFPVITLGTTTRFVEITEAVHRIIVADQYEEIEFARRTHETFIALSMERASLTRIVAEAADMLSNSVVLEDLSHQVVAFRTIGAQATTLLDNWTRRSRLVPYHDATATNTTERWTYTPIGPLGEMWGRLVVADVAPADSAAATRIRTVLERAAQALTLHRMVEKDRVTLQQQAQSGLVDELVKRSLNDEAEALVRARALGLGVASGYIPLAIRIDYYQDADPVAAQQRNAVAVDAISHAVIACAHTALCALRRNGEIGVILAVPPGKAIEATLDHACLRIRDTLMRSEQVRAVGIGVAHEAAQLIAAAARLTEATQIADVALRLPASGLAYHRVTDIRLRGLVELLRDDPRVRQFAESELGPLLMHDARHGDNHVDFLRDFVSAGGNKSQVATARRISRQTVYQRVASIERILGVSLSDGESLTSLHSALLIHDAVAST